MKKQIKGIGEKKLPKWESTLYSHWFIILLFLLALDSFV